MKKARIIIALLFLAIMINACAGKKIETVYGQRDIIGEKIAELQKEGVMQPAQEAAAMSEEILMDEADFFSEKNGCTQEKLLFAYYFISEAKPSQLKAYWWSPQIAGKKFKSSIRLKNKKLGNYCAYCLIADCNEISKAIKKNSAANLSSKDNETLIPFNVDIEFKKEILTTLMIHPQVELWEESEE